MTFYDERYVTQLASTKCQKCVQIVLLHVRDSMFNRFLREIDFNKPVLSKIDIWTISEVNEKIVN